MINIGKIYRYESGLDWDKGDVVHYQGKLYVAAEDISWETFGPVLSDSWIEVKG